jgi:hypothetical protein
MVLDVIFGDNIVERCHIVVVDRREVLVEERRIGCPPLGSSASVDNGNGGKQHQRAACGKSP